MVVLGEDSPQFEQNLEAARILPQAITQELLGLDDSAHALAQPISSDDVGSNAVRIEFRGEAQPGQNFSHFRVVAQVPGRSGMNLRPAFVQMGVDGRKELTAEGVNPITRFAKKPAFVALIITADR